MASNKHRNTFRVSNVSNNTTEEHLKAELINKFTEDEKGIIKFDRLSLAPSCTDSGNTQTGIFKLYPKTPVFLSDLDTKPFQMLVNGKDVEIDKDFFGLTQLYHTADGEVALDVLALTGLNGHAYGSWTGSSGKMWLQDFIGENENLRSCRTMIFGYNSKLQVQSKHTTRDYAVNLLTELMKARRSEEEARRRIVFIGHSFGGIVITHALVRADWDPTFKPLVNAIYRILFFGVPHRGINLGDVVKMVEEEPQNQGYSLVADIIHESKIITPVTEQFRELVQRTKTKIISFYETAPTPKVIKLENGNFGRRGECITIVTKDSAVLGLTLDHEESYPAEADHSTIVKFTNPADQTYQTVCGIILKGLNKYQRERIDEAKLYLESLIMTNPEYDLEAIKRLNGERVEGTCKWLLGQKEYIVWLGDPNPQLLRLVGAPGIGKTMISSFLVDELKDKLKKRMESASIMTFAYYFCDNKNEKRNTAIAIVRGILLQLLKQQTMLYKHIQLVHKDMKDGLFGDFGALWGILCAMLEDPIAGEVYILIDALDECEKSTRKTLLKDLENLFTTRRLKVKFLITHRPEADIEEHLQDINGRLQIDSDRIGADLSEFIKIKVGNLSKKKKFSLPLEKEVKDALEKQAQGTFLWASLVISDISETKLLANVRKKLQTLPSSLDKVYSRILGNINKEDEDDASFILQWVVEARRPLTVSELAMVRALHSQRYDKNTIPSADTLDEFMDSVKCCEPLLYLDTSNTINLIHQSAKDYLLFKYPQENSPPQYHVVSDKANLLIFKICWRYLSMEEFQQGTLITKGSSDNDFLDSYPFLRYAALEWEEHALAAISVLATDFGWLHDNLAKMPILRDAWLHRAVRKGYECIVELLLDHKADVNVREGGLGDSQTALHLAVKGRHDTIVKLLLRREADVDARRHLDGQTALHLAAERGHEPIAKLLAESKANIDAENNDKWTALHLAAENGHEAVVQLLLAKGANVMAKNDDGQMALHLAAENGHEAIVKLLLNSKTDVDARRPPDSQTALHWAAKRGHEAIIKLLLEHKADVNAKSELHQTALHLAVEGGHQSIVKLLLDYKADVDLKGRFNVKALHLAAEGGHEAIAKLLLDYKADIEAKDNNGWTALHSASFVGYEAVVRLLLERGAVVSAKVVGKYKYNQTALDLAAEKKHKAVVQLLTPLLALP